MSRIFSTNHDQVRASLQDKCTVIMLTYRRVKSLPQIITNYCNMTTLDKFLVIWNDVDNPVPQTILDISKRCSADLQFITAKENKMSNRFWPRPEIETECKNCVFFLLWLCFIITAINFRYLHNGWWSANLSSGHGIWLQCMEGILLLHAAAWSRS